MPRVFQLWDFISFGVPAIAVSAFAVLAALNYRRNRHKKWWQWVGLAVVALGFWAGYGLVLKWRADLVDRVACVTSHGVIAVRDGGTVPTCAALEVRVERTLEAWAVVEGIDARTAIRDGDGVMLFIKPMPFKLHGRSGEFAGFAKAHGYSIAVGFDGRSLERTALAHELGHVILAKSGKRADERALREVRDLYGVPY